MRSRPGALDQRSGTGRSIKRDRLASRLAAALESGSVMLTAGAGFGKTTALDQAIARAGIPSAWISCSPAERSAGTLLTRVVAAVAEAAPGASDALAERIGVGIERVDPLAATRELIADLTRLLLEPLILVVDDAEQLDGAPDSLGLLGELIRAEPPPLHVAIASRRPLELRVAKPRAAGRLAELTAADLSFDTEECGELLRGRSGLEFTPEQVEEVMEATEGWPLGIALAAGLAERGGEGGAALAELGSTSDLRSYLSEELLDSLDPELLDGAIRSSVARVVTPQVAEALALPAGFASRIESAGMLLRRLDDGDSFAYHPLLREVLAGRLALRGAEELRSAHATVAPVAAASGDEIGAIEHWLLAERWPEAVAAVERAGPALLRTSPELMESWLALLPGEVQADPVIQTLHGQLEWGAGQHEQAAEPLRKAVAGRRAAGDVQREWLARYFLAEALFSAGEFEEMLELADGWDAPGAARANVRAGVAWYEVLALTALGRYEEAAGLAGRLRADASTHATFSYLDELATLIVELPAGGAPAALERMRETVRELELSDPMGRLPVALAVIALVHLDIGETGAAEERLRRCERESERLGLGFIARDARLQRAMLLARAGELSGAELELERAGARQGTGWRGVSRPSAEAIVADARGDAAAAVEAARRALERVRPGLLCYRVWTAIEMAAVLARNGALDEAGEAVAEALGALDESFPGEAGRYHRGRLLARRGWLEFEAGDGDAAYRTLGAAWEQAGEGARHLARAQWDSLRPVLWQGLADRALDPDLFLPALSAAFPEGEAMVAFGDHPDAAVRRAVLPAALAANHPDALSGLEALIEDEDPEVVAIAEATRERLSRSAPPLRFALFGRFRVARAGWEIAEEAWGRPIDARLVRFLLVHRDQPVAEDLIFEALWPDLSASSARRSLQVSVSRVRQVLDLPFAAESVVESRDRAYRLALSERDVLDTEGFRGAADAALAAPDRAPLERARALWGGEPLADERYSDWAAPYRERLNDRHIAVLTALIELHGRAGEHTHQVDAARELVDIDPLNEEGHRALITAYARSGRRGHALRQYLVCRRAMVDELGVEPEQATSRLQARILAGEPV